MDRFDEMLKFYEEIKKHFTPIYSWLDYVNPFYSKIKKEPYVLTAEFHPNYIDRTKDDNLISISMMHGINNQYNVIYGNLYILFDRMNTLTYDDFNKQCKLIERYFKSACTINRWDMRIERHILHDQIIHRKGKEYDFSTYLFRITITDK